MTTVFLDDGHWTKQRIGPHNFASFWCSCQDTACATRLQLLSLTSQIRHFSLDLFDVLQRHADGGHCVRLKPFTRLTGARSLTVVINTTLKTGTSHPDTTAVNYTVRWTKQRRLPTLNALAAHFSFRFWVFPFPFYYRFGLFHYHFVSVFTDNFVSVFVNGICLSPFLRIAVSISVNVKYTAVAIMHITLVKTKNVRNHLSALLQVNQSNKSAFLQQQQQMKHCLFNS